nr:MAG: replication associated protein [Arizlama virus]
MAQALNWCFTYNNPPCPLSLHLMPKLSYGIYGDEIAPTTGTPHFQGYLQFSSKVRLGKLTKLIPGAHFSVARGTCQQNIDYCSKSGSVHTFGEPTHRPATSGVSSDLESACAAISDGVRMREIAERYPKLYVHRNKGLEALARMIYTPNLRLGLRTTVLVGPTGSGKTRWAYDHHPPESIYKLDQNMNGSLWFDGYSGQDVLLIDDFNGWIEFRQLLNILDIYPYLCQIKGSSVYARWTKIIITSEFDPDHWYGQARGDQRQLTRRIGEVIHMTDPEFSI